VSPYLRKVKTRSGATAVQIVETKHGQRVIVEHLGSAHTDAELAALMRAGHDRLHAGQPAFELGIDPLDAKRREPRYRSAMLPAHTATSVWC